jgi:hypothetical protein
MICPSLAAFDVISEIGITDGGHNHGIYWIAHEWGDKENGSWGADLDRYVLMVRASQGVADILRMRAGGRSLTMTPGVD